MQLHSMTGSLRLVECLLTVALLSLLVLSPTCSAASNTLYAKSTPSSPCPADPCLTLSEYAQQPHHYLTSNATLLLLPGDHVLTVNFTVENVSHFEIRTPFASQDDYTANGIRIMCQGLVGFTFRNVSHMTLHGLIFKSCGKRLNAHRYVPAADNYVKYLTTYGVSLHAGQDTNIFNCSFEDNVGTSLGVFNSSLGLSGSSTFTNNCRVCSGRNCTSICLGGGIYAHTSMLIFSDSITFTSNSAEDGAGIYAWQSTLILTGNCSVTNNSAKRYGGGIIAWFSILNFIGNTTFRNNLARFGGGMYAVISSQNFIGNTTFTNNSAEGGGGIRSWWSTITFTGNTTFRNNLAGQSSRGIIRVSRSILYFTGNTTIMNNSAHVGGIYAWKSNLNFTGNNDFRDNSAEYVGGIKAGNYCILSFSGNTIFRNNLAVYGGGIRASYSTLYFTGNTTFRDNSAEYVGGIYAWNTTLNFTGNTTFRNNSARYVGGIRAWHMSALNFTGETTFRDNLAVYGGGIRTSSSSLHFTGNTIFGNNSAKDGGGIYAWNSNLNFNGSITFRSNSAKQSCGGIWTFYSTLNFTGNATFRDNSALFAGGICIFTSTMNIAENKVIGTCSGGYNSFTSLFIDNSAQIHGGAIYASDSTLNFDGCNAFSGNSAQYYGGGIYSQNSTLNFSRSTTFSSNSGRLKGGGLYGLGVSIYFCGSSSFRANTAARGGGEYLVGSFNFLSHNSVVTMDGNNATEYGGAVYVEDSDPISNCLSIALILVRCVFQVDGTVEIPIVIPQIRQRHFVHSSTFTCTSNTIMLRYQAVLCMVVQLISAWFMLNTYRGMTSRGGWTRLTFSNQNGSKWLGSH